MAISIIDPVTHPKKSKGTGKVVLHDSQNFHVWLHGPDKPGERGPMHKHTADQIFICVEGEATYNFPDRESGILKPGMMIIIPKDHFYQIENKGTVNLVLMGGRAEPYKNPRLSETGEALKIDGSNWTKAGSNIVIPT